MYLTTNSNSKNIDMRNIILISFLFVCGTLSAQTVSIKGLAPGYLGKKIEITNLTNGTYFISVMSDNTIITKKVVVL